MTDITYDAEADAVYITVGRGKIDRTEETGPFIYDVDAEGTSSASKSCPPARFWRRETGKKQTRRDQRASAPPNSGTGPQPPDLDLRDPGIQAEIRREIAMLSQHPENAAIDDWIEAAYDWGDWN